MNFVTMSLNQYMVSSAVDGMSNMRGQVTPECSNPTVLAACVCKCQPAITRPLFRQPASVAAVLPQIKTSTVCVCADAVKHNMGREQMLPGSF